MRFRAVIFDFDGLIVDTETAWFRAYDAYFRKHGARLDPDAWGRGVGTEWTAFDPHRELESLTGRRIDPERMRADVQELYEREMENAGVLPGVMSYLDEARRLGLKVGLASSSPRDWVMSYLAKYDLVSRFDCIRTADDVRRVKPDPELYLKALECLGVPAPAALAFEDSANGALAAVRAGLTCVVVPNPVTERMRFPDGVRRLRSMAEMPLSSLLSQLEREKGGNPDETSRAQPGGEGSRPEETGGTRSEAGRHRADRL